MRTFAIENMECCRRYWNPQQQRFTEQPSAFASRAAAMRVARRLTRAGTWVRLIDTAHIER